MRIFSLCFGLFFCLSAFSEDPISGSEINYKKLLKLLEKPASVGDCAFSLAPNSETNAPEAFDLTVTQATGASIVFNLDSPEQTGGRTRSDFHSAKNQISYASSDFAGWVNLLLQLDSANKIVTGLKMYKSLPSGVIYDVGAVCGNLN